ncbi:hypothetical protein DFA_04429 [Cavenderia fasciculata]|uniref:Transmembrane protein n=1 Tax=Cavenderia fasciculata TaxID=261658 RepID=F4PPJ8_CACFS|nr:uncharacterized protein DFA_04429 [Cavenderia fasciculata]EGG22311.1 hypothetical protein DFA_04429 [Cavenderia fasciculata]|eukprot:XP_004360162.1 hypothetical protein DFA_04429 [Cavenderia fasciculata]
MEDDSHKFQPIDIHQNNVIANDDKDSLIQQPKQKKEYAIHEYQDNGNSSKTITFIDDGKDVGGGGGGGVGGDQENDKYQVSSMYHSHDSLYANSTSSNETSFNYFWSPPESAYSMIVNSHPNDTPSLYYSSTRTINNNPYHSINHHSKIKSSDQEQQQNEFDENDSFANKDFLITLILFITGFFFILPWFFGWIYRNSKHRFARILAIGSCIMTVISSVLFIVYFFFYDDFNNENNNHQGKD